MTPILLNQLRSVISSSLISKFSKRFEESEILLRKSIDTSICTVLIGLNNTIDNLVLYDKMLESISNSKFYESVEFENGKLLTINYCFEQDGFAPLNLIFRNKKGRISEMISNEIGIKSETASAILNFAVMMVLSYFKNEKQKVKAIQSSLNEEKNTILSTVPEGIRVLLGYSNFICEEVDDIPNQLTTTSFTNKFLNKVLTIFKPLEI
ncbi:DUF937 domain-containing protein [Flavobacterium sp. N3904]|uniref:DUF937 domain-containing protein n=1 Tax=Flavobacterium sp. N3904 TaxID=2986835 RepID=UPI002225A70F|nr:DUF937 domain-containing protein [Flavobacterium sp. N3904]